MRVSPREGRRTVLRSGLRRRRGRVGPAVREKDGATGGRYRRYGAVPKGAELRLASTRRAAAGRECLGTNAHRAPLADRQRRVRREPPPASGGVDGEDIENAKLRGPITLRTEAARSRRRTSSSSPARRRPSWHGRVHSADGRGARGEARVLDIRSRKRQRRDPGRAARPSVETINRIKAYLDRRRVIGVRILVTPPQYRGLTIVAELVARRGSIPRTSSGASSRTSTPPSVRSRAGGTATAGSSAGTCCRATSMRPCRRCAGSSASTTAGC